MFYILRKSMTDVIRGQHVILWHDETFYESKERALFKLDNRLEFYKLGQWEVEEEDTWRAVLHDKRERNKKLILAVVAAEFS